MGEQKHQPVELSLLGKVIRNARIVAHTSWSTYRKSRAACVDGANQKWVELTSLANLVRVTKPLWTLEIGLNFGGTFGLWAQMMPARGNLIGIDQKLPEGIENRIRAKMKAGQNLHLLESDSHSTETKKRVMDILGDNKLDFLFIDADHSYEGVNKDFETYSSLVRRGGIVAFHDILPYEPNPSEPSTAAQTMGVDRFWQEIKSRYSHSEFVEDRAQGCAGIGVLQF
jgi:predicted O-methyltransferase YrrM